MGLRPEVLMILATLFLSTAQFFEKIASDSFAFTIEGTILNAALWAGVILGGLAAVIMTFAFKKGELSSLFPFISLSFIWTALIAFFIFKETFSLWLLIGTATIIVGVIILGKSEAST